MLLGLVCLHLVIALLLAMVKPYWIFLHDISRGKAAMYLLGALFAATPAPSAIKHDQQKNTANLDNLQVLHWANNTAKSDKWPAHEDDYCVQRLK